MSLNQKIYSKDIISQNKCFFFIRPNVFEVYDYTLNNMSDIVYNQKFNKTRPTIIYIHGWLSNGEMEESVLAIRSAYRQRDDHNFIAIDWSTYSHWNFPKVYVSSIEKLREV